MRGKSNSLAETFGCSIECHRCCLKERHHQSPMCSHDKQRQLCLCSYIGEFPLTVEVLSCLLPFLLVLFTCQFLAAVSEEIARMQAGSPPQQVSSRKQCSVSKKSTYHGIVEREFLGAEREITCTTSCQDQELILNPVWLWLKVKVQKKKVQKN